VSDTNQLQRNQKRKQRIGEKSTETQREEKRKRDQLRPERGNDLIGGKKKSGACPLRRRVILL